MMYLFWTISGFAAVYLFIGSALATALWEQTRWFKVLVAWPFILFSDRVSDRVCDWMCR